MAINAGQLRDEITIQEKVSGAWRNLHVNVPAYIRPLTGREKWQADMVSSEVDTRIQIRYLPALKASMRALCGSQVFLFKSAIDPDRLRHELVIEAQEVFNE
jgi:SPP1 family predicted phage head-tail adaptor